MSVETRFFSHFYHYVSLGYVYKMFTHIHTHFKIVNHKPILKLQTHLKGDSFLLRGGTAERVRPRCVRTEALEITQARSRSDGAPGLPSHQVSREGSGLRETDLALD